MAVVSRSLPRSFPFVESELDLGMCNSLLKFGNDLPGSFSAFASQLVPSRPRKRLIITRGVLAPAGARTKIHPVKILLSSFMYLYMCTKFKDNPIVICRDMTIIVTLKSKINSVKVIIKVTLYTNLCAANSCVQKCYKM